MAKIAFVGLGNMGLEMAGRLLKAGHQMSLYNRTSSRADPLIRHGAQLHETPKDACQGVDAVFSMVADDTASRAMWLGPTGILAAKLADNGLAIECSTLSHDWVMHLAAVSAARGLRYIDAPVTGLPDAAAKGELTSLVGANADSLNAGRHFLEALSKRIIHFGPIGTGTAYKLIINLIGAVQIASAAEGMAIAERAGLDRATVADAIESSQAASPQVERNVRRMVAADHDRDIVFSSVLRLKDIEYGVRFAREIGIGCPFGAEANRIYRQLCEMGHANLNESKIIDGCRAQPIESQR
jgi:3-hydroxyisobutyrate dehydrogenase